MSDTEIAPRTGGRHPASDGDRYGSDGPAAPRGRGAAWRLGTGRVAASPRVGLAGRWAFDLRGHGDSSGRGDHASGARRRCGRDGGPRAGADRGGGRLPRRARRHRRPSRNRPPARPRRRPRARGRPCRIPIRFRVRPLARRARTPRPPRRARGGHSRVGPPSCSRQPAALDLPILLVARRPTVTHCATPMWRGCARPTAASPRAWVRGRGPPRGP